MPIFNRRKGIAFWQEPPFRSADVQQLYEYAIGCVVREDGVGMMRSGWAIYRRAGLHSCQASEFLRDGYLYWSQSPAFQPDVALAFLTDLFEWLNADDPVPPPDVYAVPPALIEPMAAHYTMRCWAGVELVETADRSSRPDIGERFEPSVFLAIARTPSPFLPARARGWARTYARRHGHPDPWPGFGA
ncbi:hypothetical protein [Micromonospora tulbaghiae]